MNDGVKSRVVDVYKGLHEQGVLHGDIRRENVLVLGDGSVCIIDFDNASILREEDISLTLREDDEVALMLNGMMSTHVGPTENGSTS